jgi:hypothetical protein
LQFFLVDSVPVTNKIKYTSVSVTPDVTATSGTEGVIKANLTASKSLGFIDTQIEDEYIEMDPIYAPVAPDEPDYEESIPAFIQSNDNKKSHIPPPLPVPYCEKIKENGNLPPKGRVLMRTKSLEDLLSNPPIKASGPQAQHQENECSTKLIGTSQSTYYDTSKNAPNNKQECRPNSPPPLAKKPEPAKKTKKPYNLFKIVSSSAASNEKMEHVISHPIVTQTTNPAIDLSNPPSCIPSSLSNNAAKGPRSYIAIEDYESQAPGCLSFKMGDKCVLLRQAGGGWWLVNIGGIEGWTPGEFWEEDKRSTSVTIAPPSVPPTKPRSLTNVNVVSSNNRLQHSQSVDVELKASQNKSRALPSIPKSNDGQAHKLEHASSAGEVREVKLASYPPPPPPRKPHQLKNDYSLLEEASVTLLGEY